MTYIDEREIDYKGLDYEALSEPFVAGPLSASEEKRLKDLLISMANQPHPDPIRVSDANPFIDRSTDPTVPPPVTGWDFA